MANVTINGRTVECEGGAPLVEVIKDAGHASNLDQPEAFNRVLLDFLGSLR